MTALLNPEITRDCKTYLEKILNEQLGYNNRRLRVLQKKGLIITRDTNLFNKIAQAHGIETIIDKGELIYGITVPATQGEVGTYWTVTLNHEQRGKFLDHYKKYTIKTE